MAFDKLIIGSRQPAFASASDTDKLYRGRNLRRSRVDLFTAVIKSAGSMRVNLTKSLEALLKLFIGNRWLTRVSIQSPQYLQDVVGEIKSGSFRTLDDFASRSAGRLISNFMVMLVASQI